jgi:hypothetical protein
LRRIFSDTVPGSLKARDTVIGETPAWRAMSLILTALPPCRLALTLVIARL